MDQDSNTQTRKFHNSQRSYFEEQIHFTPFIQLYIEKWKQANKGKEPKLISDLKFPGMNFSDKLLQITSCGIDGKSTLLNFTELKNGRLSVAEVSDKESVIRAFIVTKKEDPDPKLLDVVELSGAYLGLIRQEVHIVFYVTKIKFSSNIKFCNPTPKITIEENSVDSKCFIQINRDTLSQIIQRECARAPEVQLPDEEWRLEPETVATTVENKKPSKADYTEAQAKLKGLTNQPRNSSRGTANLSSKTQMMMMRTNGVQRNEFKLSNYPSTVMTQQQHHMKTIPPNEFAGDELLLSKRLKTESPGNTNQKIKPDTATAAASDILKSSALTEFCVGNIPRFKSLDAKKKVIGRLLCKESFGNSTLVLHLCDFNETIFRVQLNNVSLTQTFDKYVVGECYLLGSTSFVDIYVMVYKEVQVQFRIDWNNVELNKYRDVTAPIRPVIEAGFAPLPRILYRTVELAGEMNGSGSIVGIIDEWNYDRDSLRIFLIGRNLKTYSLYLNGTCISDISKKLVEGHLLLLRDALSRISSTGNMYYTSFRVGHVDVITASDLPQYICLESDLHTLHQFCIDAATKKQSIIRDPLQKKSKMALFDDETFMRTTFEDAKEQYCASNYSKFHLSSCALSMIDLKDCMKPKCEKCSKLMKIVPESICTAHGFVGDSLDSLPVPQEVHARYTCVGSGCSRTEFVKRDCKQVPVIRVVFIDNSSNDKSTIALTLFGDQIAKMGIFTLEHGYDQLCKDLANPTLTEDTIIAQNMRALSDNNMYDLIITINGKEFKNSKWYFKTSLLAARPSEQQQQQPLSEETSQALQGMIGDGHDNNYDGNDMHPNDPVPRPFKTLPSNLHRTSKMNERKTCSVRPNLSDEDGGKGLLTDSAQAISSTTTLSESNLCIAPIETSTLLTASNLNQHNNSNEESQTNGKKEELFGYKMKIDSYFQPKTQQQHRQSLSGTKTAQGLNHSLRAHMKSENEDILLTQDDQGDKAPLKDCELK